MENTVITTEFQEATALHRKIMANAEIAANALLEICQGLKEMRDKKLYLQLDMPTFESYCEERVGIKARQAYTYISTYEKLGSTVLQSNASLGITKLELIAQLPAPDRANDLSENKFEGMSVKEIKELVRKSKEQAEQLESLFIEKEQLQTKADEAEEKYSELMSKSATEKIENNNKISELNEKIKELENKPIEVAVVEPSPEDIEKIRQQVKAELEAESQSETLTHEDIDKAVAEAIKEEQNKAQQNINKQLEELRAEKAKAEQVAELAKNELAELQQKLQLSDPAKGKVIMYCEAMQNDYNNMLDAIDKFSSEEDKTKFLTAARKTLEILLDNLESK